MVGVDVARLEENHQAAAAVHRSRALLAESTVVCELVAKLLGGLETVFDRYKLTGPYHCSQH
jgi:hypothetical protein